MDQIYKKKRRITVLFPYYLFGHSIKPLIVSMPYGSKSNLVTRLAFMRLMEDDDST